ncbi:universal stress protein [Billgrantia antri]|uniref:universal stress protein n=1 Tax=Billgrantia antri TaxID=2846777 RepID=UPI003B2254B1
MYHTLLIPLDGSRHAEKALSIAAQLGRDSSAVLYLLHVKELPDDIGLLVGSSGQPFTEERRLELARHADDQARAAFDGARRAVDLSGLDVHEVIQEGRPADTILRQATEVGAEAIVMGSRGMSELKGMLMGSVSHKVMHAAGCTVITVT